MTATTAYVVLWHEVMPTVLVCTGQIIDFCLGAPVEGKTIQMHVEFLKRLPSIVHFVVRQDAITAAQIDLIWKRTCQHVPVESPATPSRHAIADESCCFRVKHAYPGCCVYLGTCAM